MVAVNGSTLGNRLAAIDRSGAWLGRQLGVSRMTVSRWLRDEQPIPADRLDEIERVTSPQSVPTIER